MATELPKDVNPPLAQSSTTIVKTAGSGTDPKKIVKKIAVHFRRHKDWIEYMNTKNDIEQMEYGFDWLGDSNFDFDDPSNQTDPSKQTPPGDYKISNRYGYIEKHAKNFNPDLSTPGTIETVMTDERIVEITTTTTVNKMPADATHSTSFADVAAPNGGVDDTSDMKVKNVTEEISRTEHVIRLNDDTIDTFTDTSKRITDYGTILGDSGEVKKIKRAYQEWATLTEINGLEYYPSYLNMRVYDANKPKVVKLLVGFKHLDKLSGKPFGSNDDEIHLLPKLGPENQLEVNPRKITKAMIDAQKQSKKQETKKVTDKLKEELERAKFVEKHNAKNNQNTDYAQKWGKEVQAKLNEIQAYIEAMAIEITITHTGYLENPTSILAYHVDKNTTKGEDLKPIIVSNDNLVGELIVLPNKVYYTAKCWIIKVMRPDKAATATSPAIADFKNGYGNSYNIDKIKKSIKRILAQANIRVTDIEESDFHNYTGPDAISSNLQYSRNTLEAFLNNNDISALSNISRSSLNAVNNHKIVYIFLHDYALPSVGGFAALEPLPANRGSIRENEDFAADVAMIFKNSGYSTVAHEIVHGMGCNHTFIAEEKEIHFEGLGLHKAVYFVSRAERKFIFQKGRTDNLMDYNYGYKYDSEIFTFVAEPPTFGKQTYNNIEHDIQYIYKYKYYLANAKYDNPYHSDDQGVSLYKWQWKIIQSDSELEAITST